MSKSSSSHPLFSSVSPPFFFSNKNWLTCCGLKSGEFVFAGEAITRIEVGAVLWLCVASDEMSTFMSNPTSENKSTPSFFSEADDCDVNDLRICFFYASSHRSAFTSRVNFKPAPIFERFTTTGRASSFDSPAVPLRAVLHMVQTVWFPRFRYWPTPQSPSKQQQAVHRHELSSESVRTGSRGFDSFRFWSKSRCDSKSSPDRLRFTTRFEALQSDKPAVLDLFDEEEHACEC